MEHPIKMDDLEGKPPIFGSTPISKGQKEDPHSFKKTTRLPRVSILRRTHIPRDWLHFNCFSRSLFTNPKNPDPSKVASLRTHTPAIEVQTLPLEGPRILRE